MRPVIAGILLLAACAVQHTLPADAEPRRDSGLGDACTVAGFARCDGECGQDQDYCRRNVLHHYCIGGLCLPLDAGECGYLGSTSYPFFCANDSTCVPDATWGAGACVPEGLCDAARAEGYELPCIWSDGTPRVTGAPVDVSTCPSAPYAGTPFCGSPCGDCPPFTETARGGRAFSVCVGRSDLRGLGICAVSYAGGSPEPASQCVRGVWGPSDVCTDPPDSPFGPQTVPELEDTTCVCVVFRSPDHPDGLGDDGFVTSIEGCRGYRERYPGVVECVSDREWNVIP